MNCFKFLFYEKRENLRIKHLEHKGRPKKVWHDDVISMTNKLKCGFRLRNAHFCRFQTWTRKIKLSKNILIVFLSVSKGNAAHFCDQTKIRWLFLIFWQVFWAKIFGLAYEHVKLAIRPSPIFAPEVICHISYVTFVLYDLRRNLVWKQFYSYSRY